MITEGIIGDMVRRDLAGNKRKEDIVKQIYFPKTNDDLKTIIKNEMKTQSGDHLDLRMVDVSGIEDMYGLFFRCENLKSIDVSNWDVSGVENMAFMFSDCKNLESIDVSNWDVSRVENMINIFSGCENLKSIDVSNWDASSVKDIHGIFNGCNFNYKLSNGKLIKI